MKRLSFALVALSMVVACNNEKTSDDKMSGDKKEEKKETGNITYPYKADYSSDFSIGDGNHAKLVLDFFKAWENNSLDDMKPMLTDSVWANFSDGNKFWGTSDSLIKTGKQFRDSYSSVKVVIDGWMPVHSNDKNEDWVLTWSKDYTTDKAGKVDSLRGHAYYQIKNNKIAGWSDFQQKLVAPPPAKK